MLGGGNSVVVPYCQSLFEVPAALDAHGLTAKSNVEEGCRVAALAFC